MSVKIAAPVVSTSWPSLSGPSVAARAGGDGPDKLGHDVETTGAAILTPMPDKPGHEGIATIVPPARYFNAYGTCARHGEMVTTMPPAHSIDAYGVTNATGDERRRATGRKSVHSELLSPARRSPETAAAADRPAALGQSAWPSASASRTAARSAWGE